MSESGMGLTIEDLRERNYEAVSDQLDNRIVDHTFEVSESSLTEIMPISSAPQLTSVISGKANINNLPLDMWNPVVLGLRLKELNLHSAAFDQEASNIIAIKDKSLLTLDEKVAKGIYWPTHGGYSSGAELTIKDVNIVTRIHSHPKGKLELADIAESGKTFDPKVMEMVGDLPSTQDLSMLLERGRPGQDFSCNSIITVGPNIALLIARTEQTPPFIEHHRESKYNLMKKLESLGTIEGTEIEKLASKTLAILKEYNLVMYALPLDDKNPLPLWERIQPGPDKKTLN